MPAHRTHFRIRTIAIALALALPSFTAGQAAAEVTTTSGASSPAPGAPPSATTQTLDRLAYKIATSLTNAAWRTHIRDNATTGGIYLRALTARPDTPDVRRLADDIADADREIARLKGLTDRTGPLLRLRIADPTMRSDLDATTLPPLVAAATHDDRIRTITAYDSSGAAHYLDADHIPSRLVYLVDLDSARTLTAGLDILRAELARHGLTAKEPATATTPGWWATKIDAIEVSEDQEPWFKGEAEIFALVAGFGQDGRPRIDTVDMPYLDYDDTVYRPNQIIVNWSHYKYNLVDVVLMEDDGDTNYLALAQALATALLALTSQGAYIPMVNAVLSAMPDSWWTDDPDYVESWYTLARSSTGRLNGASGNGWMSIEPYFVQQF